MKSTGFREWRSIIENRLFLSFFLGFGANHSVFVLKRR